MADFILTILGSICFIVVVIIPWLIGVGQVLDMIRNKDLWYK